MDTHASSVDKYIDSLAPETANLMKSLRTLIRKIVPDVEESISYQMPRFKNGRNYIFIGAFKEHIGIFPPIRNNLKLIEKLAPFANKKGNLAFKFKDEMPLDLIEETIRHALLSGEI